MALSESTGARGIISSGQRRGSSLLAFYDSLFFFLSLLLLCWQTAIHPWRVKASIVWSAIACISIQELVLVKSCDQASRIVSSIRSHSKSSHLASGKMVQFPWLQGELMFSLDCGVLLGLPTLSTQVLFLALLV